MRISDDAMGDKRTLCPYRVSVAFDPGTDILAVYLPFGSAPSVMVCVPSRRFAQRLLCDNLLLAPTNYFARLSFPVHALAVPPLSERV
jgi:hypothetical protein